MNYQTIQTTNRSLDANYFLEEGTTIATCALAHGFNVRHVYQVLAGQRK